jgi:four helix bundle protein
MNTYKELDVYQRSFKGAISIYKLSLELPKYLQFDIADDIRRAARSVPSNIAEGYGRQKSNKDITNFLRTALGSNDEVLFNLEFMMSLNLIEQARYNKAIDEYTIIGKQLTNLIKSLEN